MCHLKQTAVVVHWIPVCAALSSCLYSAQFFSIQRSVPVCTALSSCLFSALFLSIQHSISLYTTLNSRNLS